MKQFLDKSRQKRTDYFSGVGSFLLKIGISANMMTSISLITGLLAVYYLFSNNLLFIILAVIHLIADGLDGVLARLSKPTKFGLYFDHGSDRIVTFLALVKIGWVIHPLAYVVTFLFLITNIIYITSDLKSPVFFTRIALLILLVLQLPRLAFIAVGLGSIYSLVLQAMWFYRKKKVKKN